MGRQLFSYPQESRAPSHVMVTWEDKWHHCEHPHTSFFFPQFYTLSMTPYGMECSFGQVGITVPAVWVPPKFFVQPQPAGWWSEVRCRKVLDSMCKHCSAATKLSLLPALQHHCTSPKHSPALATMKKITPCQPKPAQSDVVVITKLL